VNFSVYEKGLFFILWSNAIKNWQLRIISYNKSMRYVLGLILLLTSLEAFSSPAEEPTVRSIPILDTAQEIFGTRANFAANRLDSFFATERADDELGRSRIRLRSRFDLRDRAASQLNNQYRINLRLPSLEEKFKYEYYQDKDELEKKRLKELSEKEDFVKANKLKTGWLFNSDIGVSAAIPPKLITRARLRRSLDAGSFIHRFSQQLTYITDESGLVNETRLDSDYVFNEEFIFRFVNYAEWRVIQKDFTTNHGPTLLHRLTEDDALNYGFTMQTVIDDGRWFTNNYRLGINYRRNLYEQWVYLDVIPGLDFPKEWSFRRTPFITFQLEILFGG
jgi:hypothetical protein